MLLLQERHLEQLLAGPVLSDEERDVIRWGNNAKISIPKRFGKSGTHAKTYRAATAMECLVSYVRGLYIALCASSLCSQVARLSHAVSMHVKTQMVLQIGFLYLTDMQRLQELVTYLGFGVKPTVSTSTPAAIDDVPMKIAS